MTPAADPIFNAAETLSVVFFIYNLATDDNGRPGQFACHLLDIGHVVGDGGPAEALAAAARAVAPQAQGIGVVAVLGEEPEEVLVPAPRRVARPVDEEQRGVH